MEYALIAIANGRDQAGHEVAEYFIRNEKRNVIIDKDTRLPMIISAYGYLKPKFMFNVEEVPICLLCFEKVIHVSRDDATYFSHHPETNNSLKCPYRVKYNLSKSPHKVSVAVKSMPYLIYFEEALNYYFDIYPHFTIAPNYKADICNSLKDKWHKNGIITTASNS